MGKKLGWHQQQRESDGLGVVEIVADAEQRSGIHDIDGFLVIKVGKETGKAQQAMRHRKQRSEPPRGMGLFLS